jgi:hypothetical protein
VSFDKLYIKVVQYEDNYNYEIDRFQFEDGTLKNCKNEDLTLLNDFQKCQLTSIQNSLNEIICSGRKKSEPKIKEKISEDELKRQLDELEMKKESLKNNIENIVIQKELVEEKMVEPMAELTEFQRYKRIEKEKQQEINNKFNINIGIYKQIKDELEKQLIKQIPELFLTDYDIFSFLEKHSLLDSEYKYELYRSIHYYIKNSVDSIPEFIEYTEEEDQKKYLDMFDQYEHDIYVCTREIQSKNYDMNIKSLLNSKLFK